MREAAGVAILFSIYVLPFLLALACKWRYGSPPPRKPRPYRPNTVLTDIVSGGVIYLGLKFLFAHF